MIARTPLLLATTALLLGCPQLQEHCGKYNPLFCVMELETVTETAGTTDTTAVPTTSETTETTDPSETSTSDTPTTTMPEPVCNNDSVCDPGEDGIEGCMDCLSCGNGVMEGEEECDDGNPSNSDECVSCNNARCGDGFRQAGVEVCDDGDGVNSDDYTGTAHCNATCTANVVYCGDGVCQQEFEDIRSCMQDGCLGTCGNGEMEPGEDCDEGEESMSCDGNCSAVMCGDGYTNVVAGEECDDANDADTDACLAGCIAAKCGDGVVQAGVEECDDGNEMDIDTCDTKCEDVVHRKVFVTSVSYKGTLGGLSGANAKCNALANQQNLSGNFRAWLSNETESPLDTFDTGFTGVYELKDGTPVALGWSGLVSGSLMNPINMNELGGPVTVNVWTNTLPGGLEASMAACDSWTSTAGLSGIGKSGVNDMTWTSGGNGLCSGGNALYCFEDPS
jgi:cysteine-rich repeat protein